MFKPNFHDQMMQQALELATEALNRGEVPIGAVIVDAQGQILAAASNRTEELACQLGHAEALAIDEACKKVGNWRLNGCWLYVTLQPCMMCFGLASLSRLAGIYYGGTSKEFGFEVEPSLLPEIYKGLVIIPGLKAVESTAILTQFFQQARKICRLIEE